VLVSTLLLGGVYFGLAASQTIAAACALAVVGGACNGVQMVAIGTAIQEAIEIDFQARVMSFYEALATAAPGVGYMLGGLLGAALGGRAAFMVAGAGIFAVVVAVLLARPGRAVFAAAQTASARP
jgi:MFS family permease